MPYTHTNSQGTTYYLNSKEVTFKNGGKATIHFFSKDLRDTAADSLPADREVTESPRSHVLLLKKPYHAS